MGIAGITDGLIRYDDQYQQTADKNVGHLFQSLSKDEWDFLDAWFAATPNSGENLSLLAAIDDMFETRILLSGVDVKDTVTDYTVQCYGDGNFSLRSITFLCQLTAAVALNGDCQIKIGPNTGGGSGNLLATATLTGLTTKGDVLYIGGRSAQYEVPDNSTLHLKVVTPDSGTSGTLRVWMHCKLTPNV